MPSDRPPGRTSVETKERKDTRTPSSYKRRTPKSASLQGSICWQQTPTSSPPSGSRTAPWPSGAAQEPALRREERAAAVAFVPARFRAPEPAGHRGRRPWRSRCRGADLLPDGWWEDGGVPRVDRLHGRAPPARGHDRPDKGSAWPCCSVHAAASHARSACTCGDVDVRLERIRLDGPISALGSTLCDCLWVGRSATANTLDQVAEKITEFKNSTSPNAPVSLPSCGLSWCRKPLKKESLALMPNRSKPREVVVGCADYACEFSPGKNREGLPILFVDEQIYRELPCFLIATVDKFRCSRGAVIPARSSARSSPSRPATSTPNERHAAKDERGASEGAPAARADRARRAAPDLGTLGTMVGLYETAIDELTTAEARTASARAKIVASTATVRRAASRSGSVCSEHAVFRHRA